MVSKVAIIGTGAFAQGCAALINSSSSGAYVKMGSRSLKGDCEEVIFPGLEASPVVPIPRALDGAAIVILAIPAKGLLPFADTYGPLLAGKVVVDVTNPSPEDLRHMAATLGGAAPAPAKRALRPSKAVATVVGAAMRDADARDQAHRARSAAAAAAAGGQGAFGGGFGTKDVSDIEAFEGCTAVLPASSQSAALLLQECLSRVAPGAAVVKSMCNLSSYMLLHGDPLTDIMKTVAASDSPEAAAAFQTLGQAMGLEVRTGPGLRYASTLEARQRGVLTDWQVSFWVMLISWVLMQIYTAVRYNQYGNEPWEHIVMWITNKSIGWLSLWGMMYTYAPGTIVCFMQLAMRRGSIRLPRWMHRWMDMRKPLGLLTLAALIMHLLLSTFLWAPGYYAKLWKTDDVRLVPTIAGASLSKFGSMPSGALKGGVPLELALLPSPGTQIKNASAAIASATAALSGAAPRVVLKSVATISLKSRLNLLGELSMLTGIVAGCLMGLVALTSVPCITPKVNWKEWRLLQSWQGWASLVLSIIHVLLLGAPKWPEWRTEWPALIPTITLLSTVPPMALVAAKLLLVLPPGSTLLKSLRRGAWGRPCGLHNAPVYVKAE